MISIALVEDDRHYSDELTAYLHRYEQESGERFQISVFTDGDEIVEKYTASYHIILMDIEMKFMDGMSAAEEIRKKDREVIIMFITNMPQYAMKGYQVDALDYILKPVSYPVFKQRLERAIERISVRKHNYITISVKGGFQKLNADEILYVEINIHDLIFHTVHGEFSTAGSMKKVEEQLKDGFYRCNKCYLVNLKYVDGIQNNDVVVNGNVLQVSRAKKKGLLQALNMYMNEVAE